MYRRLAEKSENVFGKQELFELAAICEEVDRRVAGNAMHCRTSPESDRRRLQLSEPRARLDPWPMIATPDDGPLSVDCVLFATLRNFCKAAMATTLFSYWLSQFEYSRGCLHEIANR
jgi:hypothetical protein